MDFLIRLMFGIDIVLYKHVKIPRLIYTLVNGIYLLIISVLFVKYNTSLTFLLVISVLFCSQA